MKTRIPRSIYIVATLLLLNVLVVYLAACDGCQPSGQGCSGHSSCCSGNCEDGTCCYTVDASCAAGQECCEGLQCVGTDNRELTCCVPGGNPNGSTGAGCSEDDDCCSGICEDGRCCLGEGQRGTCDDNDDCCTGLVCSEETHRCEVPLCPIGCYWVPDSATHGPGGHCECPGDGDGGDDGIPVPVPQCEVPCTACEFAPPDETYIMRVYNEEHDFCCVAGSPPFWAPDEATAEECARHICGCVDCPTCFHCEVENVTHTSNPYSSCR